MVVGRSDVRSTQSPVVQTANPTIRGSDSEPTGQWVRKVFHVSVSKCIAAITSNKYNSRSLSI